MYLSIPLPKSLLPLPEALLPLPNLLLTLPNSLLPLPNRPRQGLYTGCIWPCFLMTDLTVFEGTKSATDILINDTMSDHEVVASDVPPCCLFSLCYHFYPRKLLVSRLTNGGGGPIDSGGTIDESASGMLGGSGTLVVYLRSRAATSTSFEGKYS